MATKHRTNHRKEVNDAKGEAVKKMLLEAREGLKNFRFGVSGARVKNIRAARELKRDVARILTKLNRNVVSSK